MPLASRKVSQASQSGSTLKLAKKPEPATALWGALSLKKKGAPAASRKARAEGRQKFGPASRIAERSEIILAEHVDAAEALLRGVEREPASRP
jgi:hypothetical protein